LFSSTDNPCGSGDCYKNTKNGNECVHSCSDNHYEIIGKICVLKNCKDRTKINLEEILPCGVSCFEDVNDKVEGDDNNNGKCKASCLYSEHYYGNNEEGKCVLKDCDKR
jgi:hypothetical protein